MYRILRAINGYYYVQRQSGYGWKKVGGFFTSIRRARDFVDAFRCCRGRGPIPQVVEYR